jgi:hypothetical protein
MIKVTDKEYWMEQRLINDLNTVIHNLPHDWDFVCILTGNGMVRVGKSVLAQQVGYYVAYHIGTPFSIENIVFSGEELIGTAHKLPPHSVLIYDEARAELDSAKTLEKVSKILRDFFAECGMYNHFIILVLPDFFELNKRIAVTRSDFLINVFKHYEAKNVNNIDVLEYKRGYFEFYGRDRKKRLYIDGKKAEDDYNIGMKLRNYWGTFKDFRIIDKDEYEKKKLAFLRRDRTHTTKQVEREVAILKSLCGLVSERKASELLSKNGLSLSHGRISQIIHSTKEELLENPL